jgi:hypothetical protein
MHSHTPSYRPGASNKTETGNDLLIIVNGLLTIASSAHRKEWICHPAANNKASVGLRGVKSGNIHCGHGGGEGIKARLVLTFGGLVRPVPV